MPGPYVSGPDIKTALIKRLRVNPDTFPADWDDICADAATAGWRDLSSRLLSRGYTVAQLDSWDDRVSFNRDQALFWAYVNGAGLGGYSDQDYNKLDHRKELEDEDIGILINGVLVLPGAVDAGGGTVIGGRLDLSCGSEISEHSTFRTQRDRRDEARGYTGLDDWGVW